MNPARYALIIASNLYQDTQLRQLRAPVHDADALARVLRDPLIGGYEVRVSLNESAWSLNETIEEFFSERRADDLLLLHFSCHGIKDEAGELHFAASNTKLRLLEATSVSADFVNRQMNRSRSKGIVLMLDCCYSGAFARGLVPRAPIDAGINQYFRGGRGLAVVTSSSAMEYAFEGDDLASAYNPRPSVFTGAIVEGLETGEADLDHDGLIALDELYDYVYERVRGTTPNQTPSKWIFALQGDLYIAQRRQLTSVTPMPLMDAPTERADTGGRIAGQSPEISSPPPQDSIPSPATFAGNEIAGFWRRLLVFLIEALVFYSVALVTNQVTEQTAIGDNSVLAASVAALLAFLYFGGMWSWTGQSVE
jgi:Caspase domain